MGTCYDLLLRQALITSDFPVIDMATSESTRMLQRVLKQTSPGQRPTRNLITNWSTEGSGVSLKFILGNSLFGGTEIANATVQVKISGLDFTLP